MDVKKKSASFYNICEEYFSRRLTESMKTKLKEGHVKRAFQGLKKGDYFLDVGTGIGQFAIVAAKKGALALGVDVSRIGCKIGKELSNRSEVSKMASFVICDVENMPLKSEVFNLVTCFEVLEHLVNPEKCLREIARVLRGGGRLHLSTPHHFGVNFSSPFSYMNLFYTGKRWCELNLFGDKKELKKFPLEPNLNQEQWNKVMDYNISIDDICSLHSLDVLHFIREIGLKVCYFDTFAYEKDAYEMLRVPSKGSHLPYSLLRIFSKIPLLEYAGSCIYIEAIK